MEVVVHIVYGDLGLLDQLHVQLIDAVQQLLVPLLYFLNFFVLAFLLQVCLIVNMFCVFQV